MTVALCEDALEGADVSGVDMVPIPLGLHQDMTALDPALTVYAAIACIASIPFDTVATSLEGFEYELFECEGVDLAKVSHPLCIRPDGLKSLQGSLRSTDAPPMAGFVPSPHPAEKEKDAPQGQRKEKRGDVGDHC
jgi:hypothetical protein